MHHIAELENKEWLKKQYVNGVSIKSLSKKIGVDRGVIKRKLIKFEIPLRTVEESNLIRRKPVLPEEKHLNRNQRRRRERIRSQICPYCTKNPLLDKKTICFSCSELREKQRQEKLAKNICGQTGCHNPVIIGKQSCESCTLKRQQTAKDLKQKVLNYYGQKCNCNCGCQVTNFNHLTIDHIHENGQEHRDKLGLNGGHRFYRWIIKNNFPTDLQVLCWNCNCAKEYYGGCE